MPLDQSPEWLALQAHHDNVQQISLRQLFADDPDRAEKLTMHVGDLTFDFSKHLITDETLALLANLVASTGVAERRDAMFAGDSINTTEGRAVLHTALRSVAPVHHNSADVTIEIRSVLDRMATAAKRLRGQGSSPWLGFTGRRIRTIVNIGIGGSDLGPLMAVRALRHLQPTDLDVRFVSNIDGAHLDAALAGLDPLETVFVVASKTFTTIETMTNARSARAWLLAAVDGDAAAVADHFLALSTNVDDVREFGINDDNVFEFWDWVGGRYSVGSAIGFSLMCSIGQDAFDEFLDGFRVVDEHFASMPVEASAPGLAALIGVWYRNFWGWQSHAVLPYTQALDRFPAYLQQLDMESNGKRVGLGGEILTHDTAPVVWGEPGTNGQHAFYQLLHQGTTPVPCDFIGFLRPEPGRVAGIDRGTHHELLFANLVAQAEALAFGRTTDEVRAEGIDESLVRHRTFPGDRPSTVVTAPELTPSVLGQLIAFYEHRVFVQGAVWGVNSFDQWGVELGKVLATQIGSELGVDAAVGDHDSSTSALIERYRAGRAEKPKL